MGKCYDFLVFKSSRSSFDYCPVGVEEFLVTKVLFSPSLYVQCVYSEIISKYKPTLELHLY